MRIQIKEGKRTLVKEIDEVKLDDDGIIVPKLRLKFLTKDSTPRIFRQILESGYADLSTYEAKHHVSQVLL